MIVFIVNPVSGNGRVIKVWRIVEAVLQRDGVAHAVFFTESAGDARKITRELLQVELVGLPEIIAAVGGDGTVNEVVNGFYDDGGFPAHCKFGYIPVGSGNDYARGHGIPSNTLGALELLLNGSNRESRIDLLRIGNRTAANSIGCGLDGQVAKTTNEASYKKMLNRIGLGKLAYVASLVRVLTTYRPAEAVFFVDGREIRLPKVWLICIANIPCYGGGMKICPDALPDDGTAEICAVSGISRFELLRVFPLVYSGKHVSHLAASFYSGKSIEIRSARPLVIHTDGEVIGREVSEGRDIGEEVNGEEFAVRIQVLPNCLSIITGR